MDTTRGRKSSTNSGVGHEVLCLGIVEKELFTPVDFIIKFPVKFSNYDELLMTFITI